jgi:hypothetical protein
MVSKSPWSVKGVSQEDRDQAKTAARRAGLPVGVWLSQQIRSSNTDISSNTESKGSEPPENAEAAKAEELARRALWRGAPDSRFTFGPGQWSIATDAVADGRISQPPPPQPWAIARSPVMAPPQQMQAPMQSASHPAAQQAMAIPPVASHWAVLPLAHPMYMQQPPVQQPAAPMVDSEEIKSLEKRIEFLEESLKVAEAKLTRQADSFEQRVGKMEGLVQEVDELRMSTNHDAEPNYSIAPVERAVMRLSERLQRIENAVLPDKSGGGFFSRLFGRR